MTNGEKYTGPHFPDTFYVATDCVVFCFDNRIKNETGGLFVLLVVRGIEPFKGKHAFPGGFIRYDLDNDIEECAKRELRDETGCEAEHIEQLGVYSRRGRDPRGNVVTVAMLALLRGVPEVQGNTDAASAEWHSVADLLKMSDEEKQNFWAFDHKTIFEDAVKRIREKLNFEPIVFNLLEKNFTKAEMLRCYQSIAGAEIDRRTLLRWVGNAVKAVNANNTKNVRTEEEPDRISGSQDKPIVARSEYCMEMATDEDDETQAAVGALAEEPALENRPYCWDGKRTEIKKERKLLFRFDKNVFDANTNKGKIPLKENNKKEKDNINT